jgi:hypothetical protein
LWYCGVFPGGGTAEDLAVSNQEGLEVRLMTRGNWIARLWLVIDRTIASLFLAISLGSTIARVFAVQQLSRTIVKKKNGSALQSATLQICFGVADGIDDILTKEAWATRRHAPQVNVGVWLYLWGIGYPL